MTEGSGTKTYDVSGRDNHGTLTSGVTWAAGQDGWSASFNGGAATNIGCGTSAILANKPMSVAFWVKSLTASPVQYTSVVAKTNGTIWSQGWGFYWNSATAIGFFIETYNVNVALATLTPGNWNHVVGTWDGSTVKVYANAILGGTTASYSGGITAASNALQFGELGTYTSNLNGLLSGVLIYNRALSQGEIAQLAFDSWQINRRSRVLPAQGVTWFPLGRKTDELVSQEALTEPVRRGAFLTITPWLPLKARILEPLPEEEHYAIRRGLLTPYFITGVVRDCTSGAAIPGATVNIFRTTNNQYVGSVTSDGSGNYRFQTPDNISTYYLVAYLPGSPDEAGTTVNTITGV